MGPTGTLVAGAAVALGIAAAPLSTLGVARTRPAFAPSDTPRGFHKDARAELALAHARGDPAVTLVVAARPGRVGEVARATLRLGGRVDVRADDADYLRVRLPTPQADSLAMLPAIEAIDVSVAVPTGDRRVYLADRTGASAPRPAVAARPASPVPPPPATDRGPLPNAFLDPYSPLADLDAAAWRAEHPTWDGRGVTIADLEAAPDLLAPELQTAYSLDGAPIAKVADVLTVVDPDVLRAAEDTSTARWLRMRETVVARHGRFTWRGRAYAAPHDGAFRVDAFEEGYFVASGNVLGGDLDRDGVARSTTPFVVLWDVGAGRMWVDTDRDGDLRDERALGDYGRTGAVGIFGRAAAGSIAWQHAPRTTVAFTAQIDTVRRMVALHAGIGSHASMVHGAAAGNRRARDGTIAGRYDGVAPGARTIAIGYGTGSAAAIADALLLAFRDTRVDVVMLQQNFFVTDLTYRVHDGRSVLALLASRLIARYGKPFLTPVGNVPAIGMTGELAAARGAIGVGAYQGVESFRRNNGVLPARRDNLHWIGSGGPAGDGAPSPTLLAPSLVLSSDVGVARGGTVAGFGELPAGYQLASGTSTATPIAAGAVALLLSAARQEGLTVSAAQIRRALIDGARFLDDVPAHEQGHGLIRVRAAWAVLGAMGRARNGDDLAVEIRAPVRTSASDGLATPHEGAGLLDADWPAGERGERTLWVTRRGGPPGDVAVDVRWLGDDGTFTSPSTLVLPRGVRAALPVGVAPRGAGAHGALLTLVQRATGQVVGRASCVVIVPQALAPVTGALTVSDSIPRPGRAGVFVRVPPNARALTLDFAALGGSRNGASGAPFGAPFGVQLVRPDGRMGRFFVADSSNQSLTIAPAEPGTWQIALIGRVRPDERAAEPTRPLAATPFTLTIRAVGAASDRVDGEGVGWPDGGRTVRHRLASGGRVVRLVDVPIGATSLAMRATAAAGRRADVDVYLFFCARPGECEAVAARAAAGADESVVLRDPRPGRWALVVDVPAATGRVDVDVRTAVARER